MAKNVKKYDVDKMLKHLGYSEQELAKKIGINVIQLRKFGEGTFKLGHKAYENLLDVLDVSPKALDEKYSNVKNNSGISMNKIVPEDVWSSASADRHKLVDLVCENAELNNEPVKEEMEILLNCLGSLKKPKISFAGQSDTGKSTLINALIGSDKMPAKWTPTTSIIVYIKHIDDRPDFIKENVWIFGKQGEHCWSDKELSNQEYCEKFLIEKGDYEILETYGTHQKEGNHTKEAFSAIAFVDSPLLKNCDILDLPGFGVNEQDDALHKFVSQDNETDILIYLSRSNGFLQQIDLNYLNVCLNVLKPVEKKNANNIRKLANLFIVASQANTVDNGNSASLTNILDERCNALCKILKESACQSASGSILPLRTKITGYDYTQEDIRSRFFTYEKDTPRLCKEFNDDFKSISEKLPKSYFDDFSKRLSEVLKKSESSLSNKVKQFTDMMRNREQKLKELKEIKDNEPARKAKQVEKNKKMLETIDEFRNSSKSMIQSSYDDFFTEENLIEMIDRNDYKNKKNDKEDFSSLVNKVISDKIQHILSEQSECYAHEVEKYIKDYEASFNDRSLCEELNIEFSANKSFALGLTGLTAVGASGIWLATSFTAGWVVYMGAYAGLGPILAVGGVIGIGLAGVVAGIISIVTALTWKKDLAKKIIKAYDKEGYLNKIFKEVDKFWDDTRAGFEKAAQRVEIDWEKTIKELEQFANENNKEELEKMIETAKLGQEFFLNLMQEN